MPRRTSQPPPRRQSAGKGAGSGTPADRLIRAWLDEDDDSFATLAEEFIAGGRDGVISAAIRKLTEKYDDDAVDDFASALTEVAEAVEGRHGFDFAELLLLPVVIAEAVPQAAPLAAGLAGAGAFPPEAELVFAEGWRLAEAVAALSPAAVRRVLLDIAGGKPPADLPPSLPEDGAEGAVVVLVGALIFRTEPPVDDPDADPEALAASEEARASERSDAFDRWRASLDPAASRDALILPPCAPSELAEEIEALLEDAEGGDPTLDEVVDFVETAREEARGEEVVARLIAQEDGVELILLTRAGQELDRRVFGGEGGGPAPEEVRRVVGGMVAILDGEA